MVSEHKHASQASPPTRRPRLTPARAEARRAVRAFLETVAPDGLVLVALSGGADSMALAAAVAFEAPRARCRAGAIIVDHQLQEGSAEVAHLAAESARTLGLDPVQVVRVQVAPHSGPEADAREARYAAFEAARIAHEAQFVLLAQAHRPEKQGLAPAGERVSFVHNLIIYFF